jgi:endonuclease/exonuclease/phosphatase family metal-dependent hydrolase
VIGDVATLRVATFNVHHGAPRRGPVDLDKTIAACRSLDADVLAVQELDVGTSRSGGVDQPAVLAESLGMHVRFVATVTLRGGGTYGHALLSRGPLRDVRVLDLAREDGREPRAAIVAATSIGSRELSVVAMHLQNHRRGDPQPPLAVRQLGEALAALDERPAPRVALGDLNLEPSVVDPVMAAFQLSRIPTPATIPSDRPSSTPDHIAVGGLALVAVSVPATVVSDHRPVVVDLS